MIENMKLSKTRQHRFDIESNPDFIMELKDLVNAAAAVTKQG